MNLFFSNATAVCKVFSKTYFQETIYPALKKIFSTRKIVLFFRLHNYKWFKRSRQFVFNNRSYRYFYHAYNTAWRTERTVEVPIVWEIVQEQRGKRILEIGNVLSHYYPVAHDVLDKYEKAPGVLNIDVVNFYPREPYDLIVSISTLEHVGWDEEQKDPDKILRAIENLRRCLTDRGEIVVTLPLGQNPHLDRMLSEKRLPFARQYNMKRISKENDWIETDWESIQGSKNNIPFRAANGLVIGVFKK